MSSWQPLTLEHEPLIKNLLQKHPIPLSDYSFGNLWMWNSSRNYQLKQIDLHLCLRFTENTLLTYLYPLGPSLNINSTIETLYHSSPVNFRMRAIPEEILPFLKLSFPHKMAKEEGRSDYIFSFQELLELKGNKYQAKRNWIYRFEEEYSFSHRALTQELISKCMDMEEKWWEKHSLKDASGENEHVAATLALASFQPLHLLGHVLEVDGKVVAYMLGEYFPEDTCLIHVEKALPEYRGAYPTIDHLFLQSIPPVTYVNREENLGLASLTKAKESYHPIKKLTKYFIY